jgi:hypothetical protein
MGLSKRRIPLVVMASLWLTLIFIIAILSGLLAVRAHNAALPHPNPFVAYEPLWPGQSIESVAAFARQTPQGFSYCLSSESSNPALDGLTMHLNVPSMNNTGKSAVCSYPAADGIFQHIIIALEDNRVRTLQFCSDVLPKDLLLLYWGMPDSIERFGDNQELNLHWYRTPFWATAVTSPVKSTTIIKTVTLTINQ